MQRKASNSVPCVKLRPRQVQVRDSQKAKGVGVRGVASRLLPANQSLCAIMHFSPVLGTRLHPYMSTDANRAEGLV